MREASEGRLRLQVEDRGVAELRSELRRAHFAGISPSQAGVLWLSGLIWLASVALYRWLGWVQMARRRSCLFLWYRSLTAQNRMKIPIESSTSYRGRNARPNWPALIGFIGPCPRGRGPGRDLLARRIGREPAAWYAALAKPAWAPPASLVRAGMDGAVPADGDRRVAHLARALSSQARGGALRPTRSNSLLNALWAPLFFGARNIGAGLFVMVALWLTIIWTIREFRSVRPLAAWLLAPYVIMGQLSRWR